MNVHHLNHQNSILSRFIAEIRDADIQKDSLRFRRNLEGSGIRKVLDVTMSVMPDDTAVSLRGSGLVIVNPPWLLDERLAELLPDLHRLLVPDGAGGTSVEWWIGE